jgi:hypothetical protein
MRHTILIAALGWVAVVIGGGAVAEGASLVLAPEQAALVTAEGITDTEVAVRFDLSNLAGAQIDAAVVEWTPSGIAPDALTEYHLVLILGSWTAAGLSASAPQLAQLEAAWWEFSPLDYERNGGGLIRFDVTTLVSEWARGETTNYGFAIVTSDLARESAGSQAGTIKLIVTYLPPSE